MTRSGCLDHGQELWPLTLGRITEVSGVGGGAGLTLAFSLVRRTQGCGGSLLWLTASAKPFYPPDAADSGVDLQRLPLLFLATPEQASQAATRLLGSGGFDLLVWDLVSWKTSPGRLPVALLGRLNALARHHHASVVILTDKASEQDSLGCLVGLRLQVEADAGDPARVEVRVVKDKRGAVGEHKSWSWRCRLPDGLSSSPEFPAAVAVPTTSRLAG